MTATHEANPPRARQDRRAVWDNSPELRDSVRDDLTEWGQAMRGGMPDLGYPHEQPFSVTPTKAAPTFDADKIELMNLALVRLMQRARRDANIDRRVMITRIMMAMRFHFTSDRAAEDKAKIMGVSKRTFWRRVDEGMFLFWSEMNREGDE